MLVKLWHVYQCAATGVNTVELLGDIFLGRDSDRLAEPVEVCLPVPGWSTRSGSGSRSRAAER